MIHTDKQEIGIVNRVMSGEIPMTNCKAIQMRNLKCAVSMAASLALLFVMAVDYLRFGTVNAIWVVLAFCGAVLTYTLIMSIIREMKYNTVVITGDYGVIVDISKTFDEPMEYGNGLTIRREDGTMKAYGLGDCGIKGLGVGDKVYIFTLRRGTADNFNVAVFNSSSYYINSEDIDIIHGGVVINGYGVVDSKAI